MRLGSFPRSAALTLRRAASTETHTHTHILRRGQRSKGEPGSGMGRKRRTVSGALSFLVGSGDTFLQLVMLQRIHRALILGSDVTERSEVTER